MWPIVSESIHHTCLEKLFIKTALGHLWFRAEQIQMWGSYTEDMFVQQPEFELANTIKLFSLTGTWMGHLILQVTSSVLNCECELWNLTTKCSVQSLHDMLQSVFILNYWLRITSAEAKACVCCWTCTRWMGRFWAAEKEAGSEPRGGH